MTVTIAKEKWAGKVVEMVIGQGPNAIKVGGENTLPFLRFEGEIPNEPVVALEVWDTEPPDWPDVLASAFDGVMGDPVAWAMRCVDYGADLVCLRLAGAHPDNKDASPAEAAATARAVAGAVNIPLMVIGCGIDEKDAEVLPAAGEALAGKNALLGCATINNYKAVTTACVLHGHSVIATSPLDINLAKQLNILINEMDLPINRIAMDPLVGALGYGIEYAYSIMERTRLGALTGDKMLAMPVVCFVGQETWKSREAKTADSDEWGAQAHRAVLWEVITATSLVQAGGSVLVLRHPESMKQLKNHITAMIKEAGGK
ncbi:MAG: Corrinoid/iron-sulfur protein small subunit [Pelotomaculum sp. PtaU1.Bin035]|nr:MAG: Corrinoid/iron-sulfur protein small subunit [Pelotomaculum sp. PtaU1.Bin035]